MIRVLVQASSEVARAGLVALLRAHPSFDVVDRARESGRANSANEESAGLSDADMDSGDMDTDAIADIVLAEIEDSEDELQREVLDRAAAGNLVVLLAHESNAEWAAEMLRAGVRAVLPANATGPEIIAAIEAAFAGLIVLHPADLDALSSAQSVVSNSTRSMSEPLTSRESEVLQFLALGLANKEIAGRMDISEHTVKFHVASIMGKLGASSRTEAVTLGIRRGLVLI